MTSQVGSVVLADGMVWADEFEYSGIVQETKVTLGGLPKVFSAPISGPRNITLVGTNEQGWQTYETLLALQSIAQTIDGQFTLTFGAKTFTVSFRHNEPPVIEAQPLTPRTAYDLTDFFVLTLKLVSYS